MTEMELPSAVQALVEKGSVSADDVLTLRKSVFNDGVVQREEAGWIFAIQNAAKDVDPEWETFFVEALVDMAVRQAEPYGYVSEESADWLIGELSSDGRIKNPLALDALIRVIDKAKSCPARLPAFALEQVKYAVIEGQGPGRGPGLYVAGVVTEADVERLRGILYAFGGDGNVAVTRAEAEVLFDINDATSASDNHAAWSDLFVKAVANYLMNVSGYAVPSRKEALRREAWVSYATPEISSFFQRMLMGGLAGVMQAYSPVEAAEDREARMAAAEEITEAEAKWLADRIGRDGDLHENEKALLTFLADESPNVHPALQTLVDAVA